MQTKVAKFGGTSLASAEQIRKVAAILQSDPERRYVVVSAPGKRFPSDTKVTDLLYRLYDLAHAGDDCEPVLSQIAERFSAIAADLGAAFDTDAEIGALRAALSRPQRDHLASRGEYLHAKLLASYLGYPFADAAGMIRFRADGTLDAAATDAGIATALSGLDHAVIPGFFGSLPDGTIHTFSRGGSDVTGALVARAVDACLYENWTDVSGMLAADPRVVKNPRGIGCISYRELRELSYMGATVLHEDAVFPVMEKNIPINIRNTNAPSDPGTKIVAQYPADYTPPHVTGVVGKSGFTAITIEKPMMNAEVGFGARFLTLLAAHGLSFEHCPTGIDSMSVIVHSEQFSAVREMLLRQIRAQLQPALLSVDEDFALIAVVGEGMIFSKGTAARIFRAVSDASVNIRMIDQGSSERSIFIGVSAADATAAINSIYRSVFENGE